MKNEKGQVATLLTLGLVLVGGLVTLGMSLLTNNNKIAMNSRADTACTGPYLCSTNGFPNSTGSFYKGSGSSYYSDQGCGTLIPAIGTFCKTTNAPPAGSKPCSGSCVSSTQCKTGGKIAVPSGGWSDCSGSNVCCGTDQVIGGATTVQPSCTGSCVISAQCKSSSGIAAPQGGWSDCGAGKTCCLASGVITVAAGASGGACRATTPKCDSPLTCNTDNICVSSSSGGATANQISTSTVTGSGQSCCFQKSGKVYVYSDYQSMVNNQMLDANGNPDCGRQTAAVVKSYQADNPPGAFVCAGGTANMTPITTYNAANPPAGSTGQANNNFANNGEANPCEGANKNQDGYTYGCYGNQNSDPETQCAQVSKQDSYHYFPLSCNDSSGISVCCRKIATTPLSSNLGGAITASDCQSIDCSVNKPDTKGTYYSRTFTNTNSSITKFYLDFGRCSADIDGTNSNVGAINSEADAQAQVCRGEFAPQAGQNGCTTMECGLNYQNGNCRKYSGIKLPNSQFSYYYANPNCSLPVAMSSDLAKYCTAPDASCATQPQGNQVPGGQTNNGVYTPPTSLNLAIANTSPQDEVIQHITVDGVEIPQFTTIEIAQSANFSMDLMKVPAIQQVCSKPESQGLSVTLAITYMKKPKDALLATFPPPVSLSVSCKSNGAVLAMP